MSMAGLGRMADTWRERLREVMAERVAPRWGALEARERRVIVGGVALLLPVMLVFGVFLPLHDANQRLRRELPALQAQAEEAERLARLVARGGRKAAGGDVLSTVERLAREAGVRERLTRIQPLPGGDGRSLMLAFRDMPYPALPRFVQRLAEAGVGLVEMRVQRAGAPGRVHARLVVRGG